MSLAPIPFTAIVEYAKIYSVDELEDFIYIMRVMDDEYMRLKNVKHGNEER